MLDCLAHPGAAAGSALANLVLARQRSQDLLGRNENVEFVAGRG